LTTDTQNERSGLMLGNWVGNVDGERLVNELIRISRPDAIFGIKRAKKYA
jgi:hypothetical protein